MAHNLFANRMAFVGAAPWHGLGTEVPPTAKADEMCRAAGLDWKVQKRAAPGARTIDRRGEVFDRYLVFRDPVSGEVEPVALGMVGAGYELLQNRDAFAFFEPFVDSKSAEFHTAGALGNGERVWVLARLRDQIVIGKEDPIDRFLLLANSHNGEGAVSVRFTPIRVVCQNTLNLAIKEKGKSAIAVRHTRNIGANLARAQAQELKEIIEKVFADAAELFATMALRSIGSGQREEILEKLFPRTRLQVAKKQRPERWQRIESVLDDPDLSPPDSAYSLWGLYNAVVRDEDYRRSREAGQDARLARIWFGSGEALKLRALSLCSDFLRKAS